MDTTLQLRALEKDDLTFLHKLFNNGDIMQYWFGEAYISMEKLKENFDKHIGSERNRSFILTDGQEQLGFVGLSEIDLRHRHAEYAIMIDPDYQGKGYARIATLLAMDYAFSILNLHKLYLIVAENNDKARHIYEKAGFHTEGQLSEHFFVNGSYQNAFFMCMFETDYWNAVSSEK